MGGSEIAFMHGGKRTILTVTYKGEGGGSILFHQTSWDPVFLQDIDPEAPVNLDAHLQGQVRASFDSCRIVTTTLQIFCASAGLLQTCSPVCRR